MGIAGRVDLCVVAGTIDPFDSVAVERQNSPWRSEPYARRCRAGRPAFFEKLEQFALQLRRVLSDSIAPHPIEGFTKAVPIDWFHQEVGRLDIEGGQSVLESGQRLAVSRTYRARLDLFRQ